MNSIETYQQEVRNLTKFIEQNSGATVEQNRMSVDDDNDIGDGDNDKSFYDQLCLI